MLFCLVVSSAPVPGNQSNPHTHTKTNPTNTQNTHTHQEQYWPDPEAFRPERFLSDPKESAPYAMQDPLAFLPFGLGTRRCLGYRCVGVWMGFSDDGLTNGLADGLTNERNSTHLHNHKQTNSFALDIASLVLAVVVHEYQVLPPSPPEVIAF